MAAITTVLWDVGGVLLTNGWDTPVRQEAVERFSLDPEPFEARHREVLEAFECGRVGLDAYVERVVRPDEHAVDRRAFRDFMLSRSRLLADTALPLVDRLAGPGGPLQVTLNNESLDLNLHRIAGFGLQRRFTAFFSSCFLGVKKPDLALYQRALWITHRTAAECLFIDDREANLEPARRLGMHTLRFEGHARLEARLAEAGLL